MSSSSIFCKELLPFDPHYHRWLESAPLESVRIPTYRNGFYFLVNAIGFRDFCKDLNAMNEPQLLTRQQSEGAYYSILFGYYEQWDAARDGFRDQASKEKRLYDAFHELFSVQMRVFWRGQKRKARACNPPIEFDVEGPKFDPTSPYAQEWMDDMPTPPKMSAKHAAEIAAKQAKLDNNNMTVDMDMDIGMAENEGSSMDTTAIARSVEQAEVAGNILVDENDAMEKDMGGFEPMEMHIPFRGR